jgi:hypothetical protein
MVQSPAVPSHALPEFELPRSIAIEGPIRVGKSTLSRILADRLHARRVFDPEDNPFLADFYREKPGSAFRSQLYFLIERHQRLMEAQGNDAAPLVSDFLFEKDKIFAYINLDNEELKLYASASPGKNLPRKNRFRALTSRKWFAPTSISFSGTPRRTCWSSILRKSISLSAAPTCSNSSADSRNRSRARSTFFRSARRSRRFCSARLQAGIFT